MCVLQVYCHAKEVAVSAAGWWRSQSRLLQVIEVWHTRPGRASEAVPVLASLDAHLLWVWVALGAAQGRSVPARLQLSRQRVGCLSALQLGRTDPWMTPAFSESSLRRGGIREWLVAHVRGRGLVRGGRWKVQELAQWLQWLTLEETHLMMTTIISQQVNIYFLTLTGECESDSFSGGQSLSRSRSWSRSLLLSRVLWRLLWWPDDLEDFWMTVSTPSVGICHKVKVKYHLICPTVQPV